MYLFIKSIFDFLLSLILSIILCPFILFIIIFLRIFTTSDIFFSHKRVGEKGKEFNLYKFRTMRSNRTDILNKYLSQYPEKKIEWDESRKLKDDPRVTSFGKILRDYSLDEIPQLFNILIGDMSFVGPRPIVAHEISKYGDSFNLYKSCKPGLTGLWQVSGRNNTSYQERVDYDSYYVKNRSLLLDCKILLKTIPVVLSKKGAY